MIMYLLDKQQRIIKAIDKVIIEATMVEEINTANQLTFSVMTNSRINTAIQYVCIPATRGDAFLMFKLISETVKNDRVEYTAVESAYDELKAYSYIKDMRPSGRTAGQMLEQVIQGTRWSLGYIADTNQSSTSFYYITVLEAIQKIVELFNVELTFDVNIDKKTNVISSRRINLYTQQGERTGKRFEYGSNLLEVTREQSSENLITALVGRGKGEEVSQGEDGSPDGYGRRITFADVEWKKANGNPADKPRGQEYVEDKDATALYGFSDGRPRIGLTTFEDITDPQELLKATWASLQIAKRPQVAFKASVLDVGSLGLGDTVAIIRHDLGIEYFTRVYKVEHDLLNKANNTIELGDDFSQKSLTNYVADVAKIAENVKNTAEYAVSSASGKNKNYYSKTKPQYANEGDNLFLDLGNGETELYAWHNGNWELVVSTADTTAVERQIEQTKKEFAELDAKTQDLAQTQSEADKRLSDRIESVSSQAMADAQNLTNQLSQAQDTLNAKILDAQSTLDGKISTVSTDLSAKAQVISGIQQDLTAKQKYLDTLSKQSQSQGSAIGTLQSDVTGIKGQYADLSGNVNSLQASASGLQADMKDAKGNISSLQAKASGFEASMKNAQGDIASVQVDVNGLKTTVAGKVDNSTYATFTEQTNKKIELTATKLDNLSVGARNWLQGTADFSVKGGLRSNNIDAGNLTYSDYNDKIKMVRISEKTRYGGIYTPWGQAFPNGQLQVGDDYTFSFDAKGTGTFSKVTNEGENKAGLDGVSLTDSWKRYSVTGKITALNKAYTIYFKPNYDVYIKCLKVERGTIATDWTPAPEDTDASIADLTSKYSSLKVDTDGIHTQVGEIVKNVDGVAGRMSSVETSINQTKQAIEQKASKTEVDSLSGRVKTAESTLKQTADGLELTNKNVENIKGNLNTLSGKVTANNKEFGTVYTKITQAKDDAVNAIKGDSKWGALSNIITNSSFLQTADGFAQQVSKQIVPAIDGIKIGTRNLLQGTSDTFKTFTGNSWLWAHTYTNFKAPYISLANFHSGDWLTYSVWCHNKSSKTVTAELYFYDQNSQSLGGTQGNKLAPGATGWLVVSRQVTSNSWYVRPTVIATDGNGTNLSVELREEQMVNGNKRVDWTPAPEDLATVVSVNKVIDTADSHTQIIKDYLTNDNSQFKLLKNAVNLKVEKGDVIGQINLEAGKTLIQNQKVYLDADTVAFSNKAFIPSAAITDLSADKITTGTLNAAAVKVINIDASKITSGTISGNNLSLNLNDGTVSFKKGKIVSNNNKLILNIDDGSLAVGDASQRQGMMFNQGKMYLYDQGYFGNSTWNGNVYDWILEMKKHPYAVLEYSSSFSGTSGSIFGGSGANFHSTSGVAIAYDKNVSQTASAGTTSGIFDDWNPLDGHGVFINENGIAMGAEDKLVSIVGGTSFRYGQYSIWNYKPTILVGTNLWTDNVYDHGYNVNKMISDGPNIYMQASALITDTAAALFRVENGDVEFAIKGNDKNVIINASSHTSNGLIVKGSQNVTNWLGCQDLSVRGNKNSVVQTSQGWTKINAYETAEYYFGDLGTTNTGANSLVRIDIDPIFKETVNTNVKYQVFLTSYGPGYAWVSERTENYFVIESNTPNLEVGYEIKAKRKGYEGVRLEIDRNMEERTNE